MMMMIVRSRGMNMLYAQMFSENWNNPVVFTTYRTSSSEYTKEFTVDLYVGRQPEQWMSPHESWPLLWCSYHSHIVHQLNASSPNATFNKSYWKDFCGIWYWGLLWTFLQKLQIWLKISGTLHEDLSTFYCCQWH